MFEEASKTLCADEPLLLLVGEADEDLLLLLFGEEEELMATAVPASFVLYLGERAEVLDGGAGKTTVPSRLPLFNISE